MSWSWYLAVDMQCFLIVPFLTWMLFKKESFGYLASVLLWAISVIFCLVESVKYQYPALQTDLAAEEAVVANPDSFTSVIYLKPWARIQPYLIGVLAAYIHFRYGSKLTEKLKKGVGMMFILIAAGILYGCVFIVRQPQIGGAWSVAANASYIAFSKTFWGLGLSALILVCCNGGGSVVNEFLSASFWTPLARVGLSAYLVHLLLIEWMVFSSKTLKFFSDSSIVLLFMGIVLMTYSFGFLLGTFVEMPTRNVGKLLFF
jgi:peptidoglycan/LPS O-acetylase OafA/YrhL